MKIVSITGHKHSKKYELAYDLCRNSEVEFIKPYTDRELSVYDIKDEDCCIYVSKNTLDIMLENYPVLSMTRINGARYVFFKCQCTASYNVMILDDYALVQTRDNWNDELYTIKLYSKENTQSDRVGVYLYDHEFDEVFHYGEDSIDDLEVRLYESELCGS